MADRALRAPAGRLVAGANPTPGDSGARPGLGPMPVSAELSKKDRPYARHSESEKDPGLGRGRSARRESQPRPHPSTGKLGGTGKVVILPVDQGFEHGPARSFAPNPPAYDPHYHYQLAIEAGLNAYAARSA